MRPGLHLARSLPRLTALGGLLLAAAILTGCRPRPPEDIQRGVLLLPTRGATDAAGDFDLRFDEPVVALDQVGIDATELPLHIEPPLPGRFVWTSRRSGLFTVSEAPRPATRYVVTLQPGLRNPAGQLVAARLRRTFVTPGLEVHTQFSPYGERWSEQWYPNNPVPTLYVLFNHPVRTDDLASHLNFVADTGQRIGAKVVIPDFRLSPARHSREVRPDDSDWNYELPVSVLGAPGESAGASDQFSITPVEPLPPASRWNLVMTAGLPSTIPGLRLPADVQSLLGPIHPFGVEQVLAINGLNREPRIMVRFSRPLPTHLTERELTDLIRVTPMPPSLTIEPQRDRLVLTSPGRGLGVGPEYTVRVVGELVAADGTALGEEVSRAVRFEPLEPRIFLPTYSGEQMASGHRDYRVVSVNVPRYQLRSKRLDRPHLIHALRGFGSYFKGHSPTDDTWSPHSEVDFNLVPGVTALDRAVRPATGTDQQHVLPLGWEEMLGGRRHGALFLEARVAGARRDQESDRGSQTVLQLTDLGLHWKQWDTNVLVQVFSYATGEGLAGVTVQIVSEEDELRSESLTDDAGLARLQSVEDTDWIVATRDDDIHALSLRDYDTSLFRTGVPTTFYGEPDRQHLLLFSDRNLYRPGDTLHLKAITRTWRDEQLTVPTNTTATLTLTDPRWDTVLQTNLTFGPLGSLDLDLALPSGPRGGYTLRMETGAGGTAWWPFSIADYQPDAFEVSIAAPAKLAPGESARVPISAQYLFGSPVSRGDVRWTIQQSNAGFAPAGFEGWTFVSSGVPMELRDDHDSFTSAHGEGLHTSATNFVLAPEVLFDPDAPQPREIDLHVELTDLNQQTIRASATTLAHSSECYLGVKPDAEVLVAGETATFPLCVVGRDEQPWSGTLPANVRVSQLHWETVRFEGAGGRPTYRSECVLTNTTGQAIEIAPMVSVADVLQPASQFTFTPTEPGQYLLEIEATDPGNRRILTRTGFHVAAEGRLAWDYRDAPRLELVPDRQLYQPGDTATVLVKAPFSGQALVSVERGSVRRVFQTRLEGNAPAVRLPIEPEDAPNVFVVVTLLRGANDCPYEVKMPDYRYGACELKVARDRHRLALEVVTDTPEYRPGAEVRATVTARDSTGGAVPGAELTLFAVDDGVLNLGGYEVPDPLDTFLATQPLGVRTSLSLFKLLGEDPDRWTYPNKGYVIGGGGREAEALRQNFIPCPLWIASLLTDADGIAIAEFQAPDSLTRYRLIVVGHTADSRFGQATAAFETRKPLMLTPALPQFARVGDHLLARALLHNQSGADRQVTVTLAMDGDPARAEATETNKVETTLAIAAGKSSVVEFPVAFLKPGPAEWTWVAATIHDPEGQPEERDAVRSLLQVEHRTPLLRQVLEAVISEGGTNLLAGAEPHLLGGEGAITVRASDSRALSLSEAFHNLLHYPYGCVEQTCSSLLPWLVVKRDPALAEVLKVDSARMDAAIQTGVERLFSMQTASGGVSYWPGENEPQHWASAYAAAVLAIARSAGVAVPESSFNDLVQYLHQRADAVHSGELDSRSTAHCLTALAFAMSDLPMPALHDALFARRGRLNSEEQMLLAAAIALGSGADERTKVLLAVEDDETSRDWYGSVARRTAIRLLASTFCDPASPDTHTLARNLLKQRHRAHWGSTQGNAWAAFALLEYLDRQPAESGPATGRLTWQGEETAFELTDERPSFRRELRTHASESEGLDLVNTGPRTLFIETEITARAPVNDQPLNQGFQITRTYQRMDPQGELQPIEGLKVGDPVFVTLDVHLDRPAHFIAIDDPLPAVLEVANLPSRRTTVEPGAPGRADDVRTLWSSFREVRADRVLFFADHVGPGAWQVRYLTRARAAGEVIAPPAKVEAMYDPERRGLTAAIILKCDSGQ